MGVVLSNLFESKTNFDTNSTDEDVLKSVVASSSDIDRLIDRWSLVTSLLGLETEEITSPGSKRRRKKILGHMRAILSRAKATDKELKALHGLCSAILDQNNKE